MVKKVGCRLPSPKWPKVAMSSVCLTAVCSMKRIIFASSLRGTVASSRIVVGLSRARAEKALRRAVARYPFVPADARTLDDRCREVYSIQIQGLARRMEAARVAHVMA